ncbi:MAG: EI24 domain-containing protein [Alphaproteobacteria bacterium]|nr:EI24 domain-containing protein [Alphaproteobacteria bacterium]
MFASFGRALASLFDPALLGLAARAVILTVVLFCLLILGSEYLLQYLPTLGAPWVNRLLALLLPVIAVLGFLLLGAPVAALFASLYLDRVANAIEARSYPADGQARHPSLSTSIGAGVRLAGLVILADVLLLPVDALAPGPGEALTIIANGLLLGREYFELAALRHVSRQAADALRRRNKGRIFAFGLVISAMSFVPLADFVAPLFGAALMVHLFKRLEREKAA